MKHQVWRVVGLRSILRLPLTQVPHLPKLAPTLSGSSRSRRLLKNGENSREALLGEAGEGTNQRVPKGYLAVYVGPELRRFVIPASCLAMPEFRMLMDMVAEEFGFEHQGGIRIPCEEAQFEEILARCLELKSKRKKL
ncbi:auxin-responsive protein SAUR71-like [Punica granatum]|uniref:Uncharacterized protein n=2 Tax=Punica granatum TaxID=22663 RepID=A0A218WAC8_PUNGR|nr:auxin-responsive protein SAUR71-like [Punica granatum]OWM69483.1 hypothetical protein CDL15_Pgr013944 [Punica granatum]PKI38201.1 hypothetical protein CRG98_041454 [Punica granatum]